MTPHLPAILPKRIHNLRSDFQFSHLCFLGFYLFLSLFPFLFFSFRFFSSIFISFLFFSFCSLPVYDSLFFAIFCYISVTIIGAT